jgi:hypothetical protein
MLRGKFSSFHAAGTSSGLLWVSERGKEIISPLPEWAACGWTFGVTSRFKLFIFPFRGDNRLPFVETFGVADTFELFYVFRLNLSSSSFNEIWSWVSRENFRPDPISEFVYASRSFRASQAISKHWEKLRKYSNQLLSVLMGELLSSSDGVHNLMNSNRIVG